MENKYYSNYFKSIGQGLEESLYYSNQQLSEPQLFFQTIKGILKKLRETKSKIYFFGNGASAAFANHMALDFSKNGKILSRSLSDSSLLTALSNDFSYEKAMLEYLKIEGVTKDDLVIFEGAIFPDLYILNRIFNDKDNMLFYFIFIS